MRECKQKQCVFLNKKYGCRKCEDCSALPFIVADDCLLCYNCENIPGSCRWTDDNIEEEGEMIEVKNGKYKN